MHTIQDREGFYQITMFACIAQFSLQDWELEEHISQVQPARLDHFGQRFFENGLSQKKEFGS
jgi:hypothetical protein